ncbi:MAG: hypothetical protein GY861_04265, partial [bacterium]|nr:hypothetical protein [bacterium]
GELKKLVGEEKYYKTLKALGYEKSNYILDKKVQNQVIRELSQPSIATELRKDRPPLKSKLEPGENVRFKKFLNAFETRLGKEDAVNVYSNVLGIDPIQRPVGVMKNQLAKLESLDAKRKVLTELAKAIERKKEYGKYGSATKIVKQKKRFGKLSEPLYECEHNIIKLGKDLAKPQKWLGTHARVFIDQLPKPLKDLLWHGMHKADHNSKVEYMKLEKDVDYFSRGMDRGFNKRIGIYAAKQQEMGIATLKSMGYKDKEINRKLSPKEMSLYNWMRKNFESMYDRIQEERVKAGAEPFPKVKNYFTFMRQMNEGTLLGLNPIKTDPAIFLESKFAHPRTTSFKYRKAREKAIQPIDLNAGRVFKKYMHDATFHVHTAPILSKTRDMISKVGEYDLKKEKPHLYTFLSEWSDEVAGVKFPSEFKNPKVDSALRFLCNNIAYATLSGMVRSAIIQPAAIRNTWVRIGLSDTLKGVAQGLNPTKAREAMSKSNNLLIREFDVNWEEAQTSLTTAYQRGQAAVGKQGYKPLAFLDMVTARATWLGSFEKAKRTMSEKESIRFADEIVTTTQASASRMDRSPAQRTALGRAATLFNTFVIMDYEFLKHDVMGINNPKMTMKDAIKKSMTYLISTALISSLYEDVIGVNSPFPTPVNAFMDAKDEGATNAEASYQVSKELLQMFPVWGGSLEYGSSPAGAAVDTIERMVKYGSKGALPDLGTAGQITGIPGSVQGNKYLKNRRKGMTIWDALVGSKKKPKKGYKPY